MHSNTNHIFQRKHALELRIIQDRHQRMCNLLRGDQRTHQLIDTPHLLPQKQSVEVIEELGGECRTSVYPLNNLVKGKLKVATPVHRKDIGW